MNSSQNLGELPWNILLVIQDMYPDSRQVIREEIIRRCPEFETKLNENLSNLFYMASEYGYVEIVKVLLCFDRYHEYIMGPLDYAAMNGDVEVINVLLDFMGLSLSATTSDFHNAILEKALYLAIRGNQCQAFRALAIKYMENWNSKKVAIIKTTNKLLMETPRQPDDDVPTGVFKTLNELLLLTIRRDCCQNTQLEEFLASDPLLFKALSSQSCPLQTQFYLCVFTGQTDDLLDRIEKMRYALEIGKGRNRLGPRSICLLKDGDGYTPLHWAAQTGKASVINILLSTCWECAGLVSDKANRTALHCALISNKNEAFKTLLEWYIIKEEFSNNNVRDWDCRDADLDLLVDDYVRILKELLGQKDSKICFQRESQEGNEYFAVIKCKNKGISFKYRGYVGEVTSKTTLRTILSLSEDSRSIITLKVLISSVLVRWILDVRDVDGNTVFDLLGKGNTEEIRTTNVMGFVPYERYENVLCLLDAIQLGDYETFSKLQVQDRWILDYVCELPLGGTPLHIAVRLGQLNDCTREIIRKRHDFAKRKDHKGRNPLHIASSKGYLEILKELLTQLGSSQCFDSADNEEGKYLGTPLEYAIRRGRISVIKELLPIWWNGAGVIMREGSMTLLEKAVENKQFEALKMLMERYIEDELLKAKEVDENRMSSLADGYIEIVLKHLLSPKVNYSLSILVNNIDNEEMTGTRLLEHLICNCLE